MMQQRQRQRRQRRVGGSLRLPVVGLEADLEDPVAQGVPVEGLDGHQALVVVGHGDESKALALVGLQVADDFDRLDGAERAEQLPQHRLLRVRSQIVHEYTPTGNGGAGGGGGGELKDCEEFLQESTHKHTHTVPKSQVGLTRIKYKVQTRYSATHFHEAGQ